MDPQIIPSNVRSPLRRLVLPALAGALALGARAFAQEYYSNDITPAGSVAGKLSGTSGGRHVGAAQVPGTGYSHAVLVGGNALNSIDLNPASCYYSAATCADDSQQGGWGYMPTGIHALVWSGSASAYADLNPSGYNFSYCLGVHGGEQVGYAQNQSYFVTASHAMLWHGSAASAVDLHPLGYAFSRALGCRQGGQVGYVSSVAYPDADQPGYHTTSRAVRWSGSADSAVFLHPLGFDASEATCTSASQQAGWGYLALGTSHLHAILWSGTAESVVDLHPAGYTESRVNGMSDTRQVGDGWVGQPNMVGSVRHALVWSGSADTVVDLNPYLPAGYTHGVATGIDANGNVVGYAYNGVANGLTVPNGAIAVVFAPGTAPAAGLSTITLAPSNVAPGDALQATIALAAPAPAGGVTLDFLSTSLNLLSTPASVVIPEGQSTALLTLAAGGATLTAPASGKLYVTDGILSRAATFTVTPVVKLSSLAANPVEGGFASRGTISLSIPAQAGGAVIGLTSGNPTLATVPASVTVPAGYSSMSFAITTAPVAAVTTVPLTATLGGQSVAASISLSPAPVISLSALSIPSMVGGQPFVGTISLNNFPRDAAGAVISLTSGDSATLQVPATVTVPQGAYSVSFTGTSTVVNGLKGVSVKAVYNGSTLSTTVMVNPIPTVTIVSADYALDTKMFKVQATTTFTNAILTYGGDAAAGPIGTMQFEQGVFKGSIVLDTPPTVATVWNSLGGQASLPVTLKTGTGGNSTGGGGGGGGGSTTTAYKLVVKTAGKGTVAENPAGTSFAAGTTITLTATPAAGSLWTGWSGDVTSTSRTITVTMDRSLTLQANFK